jgi:hypothetical protein
MNRPLHHIVARENCQSGGDGVSFAIRRTL